MKKTIGVLTLIFCIATAVAQKRLGTTACRKAQQQARKDIRKGSQKYYSFGIVAPSPRFVARMKKEGIEVMSRGCVVQEDEQCYNAIVDSGFKARTGHSIMEAGVR